MAAPRIRLVRRPRPSRLGRLLAPLIAFVLALGVGAGLLAAVGFDPVAVYRNFLFTSLTGGYQQAELLVKASPLILMALGLALAYRANVWNIGAEGQYILGAIGGGGAGLALQQGLAEAGAAYPIWPLMLLAGAATGALWAAVPALLRTRFNASELLTSLMLVYIAQHLLHYLVQGPWRDPMAFAWPKSPNFIDAATLPLLVDGTRLHWGVLLIPLVAIAFWILFYRTALGYRIRVQGSAPLAGRFSGFRASVTVWLTLLLSGALAGMAGTIEAANTVGHLSEHVAVGFGFSAIIVAFLGRLHPLGIVLAGLVLAYIALGGETVQTFNQVPQGITLVLQALLLLFVLAADFLVTHRLVLGRGPNRSAEAAS
jgi:simple sugar transport system permease protein